MMKDNPCDLDPEGWVDRHGDLLFRYALRMLGVADLAAEIVQEAFLEAFQHRHSFAGRSSERTWLVGILRHKILDHFRKARRQRQMEQIEIDEKTAEDPFDRRGHWKVSPRRWRNDPAQEIESREFRETLNQCLSRLPSGLSETFHLREIDGLDGDEVCDVLKITPVNLWKRLHRARLLLRECLERHWFGTAQE